MKSACTDWRPICLPHHTQSMSVFESVQFALHPFSEYYFAFLYFIQGTMSQICCMNKQWPLSLEQYWMSLNKIQILVFETISVFLNVWVLMTRGFSKTTATKTKSFNHHCSDLHGARVPWPSSTCAILWTGVLQSDDCAPPQDKVTFLQVGNLLQGWPRNLFWLQWAKSLPIIWETLQFRFLYSAIDSIVPNCTNLYTYRLISGVPWLHTKFDTSFIILVISNSQERRNLLKVELVKGRTYRK